jgi:hypothetical protein
MNIRFQTKLQAQKALGRTGRVFGGSLMVGVSPCLDPPADATANASQILDHTSHQQGNLLRGIVKTVQVWLDFNSISNHSIIV